MAKLEPELSALEARVADAQKSADAFRKALQRLRNAARLGHLADIEKGLPAVAQRGQEAEAAARAVAASWKFDASAYFDDGFADELRAAAEAAGVSLIEKDGRLYAFPLLLRLDSREATVRVGKKVERRIRPRQLVQHLAAMQKRPQRFREQQFLERLYRVYQVIARPGWQQASPGRQGPAVPLVEIHELLTLMLPASEYPIEEFGRDLLLLARQPDLRTRDGAAFEFPGSTLSKGKMRSIAVYDEKGSERLYFAIRFVKEA